ncbi:hypothetical protein ME0901_06770 [Lactobacillus delbrueckii subsp. bulgaricus]|uniref:Amino acid permease n=1 Tax=Lactobacillus delbrueckii subsp. bulgaricus TaxID=1585 RepID=A0AAV5PEG3_LACDE|nr:hypothetical protein [Lactobacillus delbrueckii]EHE90115.1 hypothetical protein LDBUL1632_00652 [Lactobacillus delbrueckii subsp. bulgaricus CNCM I-1632]OAL41323.1 S-methylmethionine permease [Lactobacillus delbrueckii subsp. bulgaricus]GMB84500.1 hypothetical protein ME0899_07250 [Lactobacillus delbrueckii subsp. bulgaricus]GMB86027.1 hypothetical protein ME0900_03990 [Lactobacillus delbrueckii subsp. bulgaricus]GMB88156.1 hypothetical protein ME0901_06770 [Lactobacillus delbrueckii subsp.
MPAQVPAEVAERREYGGRAQVQAPLYPFTPWFAFIASLASCLLIWFDPSQRVALYATIPFVIFCYVAHHFYAKHQEKKQTSL